ncbi:methyltransferase protein [Ascosphaera acerosa]|nr:methyltransferase protein [Ascosphaera acerosa]
MAPSLYSMAFTIGQHETARDVPVRPALVQLAVDNDFDFITADITTPAYRSKVLDLVAGWTASNAPSGPPQPDAADSDLTPGEATAQIAGVASSWLDLCSPDPVIADVSRQVLAREVAYAAFCGIAHVILPKPQCGGGGDAAEGLHYYALAVRDAIAAAPYMQFLVSLDMIYNPAWEQTSSASLASSARRPYTPDPTTDTTGSSVDLFGTWDAWHTIRSVCKYPSRLSVALRVPALLPPADVQTRWLSEPVRALVLPASSAFQANAKGFPVLAKTHQAMLAQFMRLKTPPWLIVSDAGPLPGQEAIDLQATEAQMADQAPTPAQAAVGAGRAGRTKDTAGQGHQGQPHLAYLRWLQERQPARSPMEEFGAGYQDYLQAPLQPLAVNLESITYEVFEKDPVKYEWYERAITRALRDWVALRKPTSGPDGRVTVAVAGAGRGPLVTRALRASAAAAVEIDLWVVEKNYNAFVLLQRHNRETWGGKANLVHSDMRAWEGPPRRAATTDGLADAEQRQHTTVDILVSELLGSFGDNELSPECLDGAQHLLQPEHGISIPASYSAHITPVSAPKIHADITAQSATNPAAPETPFVVFLQGCDFLSTLPSSASPPSAPASPIPASPASNTKRSSSQSQSYQPPTFTAPQPNVKPTWSFSHLNPALATLSSSSSPSNAHNSRSCRLTFLCKHRGVCHGLAGYFETVLYPGVELSTNPLTIDAKSKDMISWFPIFFPLKTPLLVPDGAEIAVSMYRKTDDRKVWYEWIVEVWEKQGAAMAAASPRAEQGRQPLSFAQVAASPRVMAAPAVARRKVGMSELHSSIQNGCLM